MSGALAAFEDFFFRQPSPDPAVAAAVTVLYAASPPPPSSPCLDPALQAVAPHLASADRAAWISALAQPFLTADITTPRRISAFLGQCSAESGGLRELEENLSYSATRLCEVWPNRFPSAEAAEACAMHPEVLANRVYAGRMGNGDEASGDGWRFRGRGLIQITGRTAYAHFAQATNMTLDQAVDQAVTQAGAASSAAWFWTAHELNTLADTWSIDLLTRKINGGADGAAERSRLCEAALQAIGA
jgi:putative chitinase